VAWIARCTSTAYAPTILTSNGFSKSSALHVSVALGVTYLVMMRIGLSIVDRIGRRRLTMTMTMIPGAALALIVLGTLFVTGHSGRSDVPFIVACLVVFMFFNAGGLQLMGWLTGSEIYPLAVRGAGTCAQAATLWTTNLLITLSLLSIINRMGVGPTTVTASGAGHQGAGPHLARPGRAAVGPARSPTCRDRPSPCSPLAPSTPTCLSTPRWLVSFAAWRRFSFLIVWEAGWVLGVER